MNAILKINGWKKIENLPEDCFYKGYVHIALVPPVDMLVRSKDIIERDNIKEVILWKVDDNIFEYKY